MEKKITNFFTALNKIQIIEKADYTNFKNVIETAKAISRASNFGVYVFDYFKRSIVYASKNMLFWCGISDEEIYKNGYDTYLKYIPENDLKMLVDINNAAFDFFNKNISYQQLDYSLSYDFHVRNFMVNQHYTPVLVKNNKIWIALCLICPSSKKTSGNVIMKTGNGNYKYSFEMKKWVLQPTLTLSDKEKLIIRYSAQGYSMKEIAARTFSSENTIKIQKQKLFKKLNVVSISEAIRSCIADGLL